MKDYVFILLLLLLACKTPSEPVGISVSYQEHIDTVDFCRAIDVEDMVLVAALGANGYSRYNILDSESNPSLELANHIPDINPQVGDDAAYEVLISGNLNDMAFILDDVDNIMIEYYESGETETMGHCGNSLLYRSFAVNDDIQDTTILFTLQKHFDVLPADFIPYSTSIGARDFYNIEDYGQTFFTEGECDPLINLDLEAMEIFYANNLLAATDGALGVKIYKYQRLGSPPNQENHLEFIDDFYIQGGEAESLFIINDFVMGGFSNDRGCYIALLDSNGDIVNNLIIANGYSISAIHYNSGLLALAAGNDGILLYEWNESMSVAFKGILDTGNDNYVFDVHVSDGNIYVGSENGISIYKIGN